MFLCGCVAEGRRNWRQESRTRGGCRHPSHAALPAPAAVAAITGSAPAVDATPLAPMPSRSPTCLQHQALTQKADAATAPAAAQKQGSGPASGRRPLSSPCGRHPATEELPPLLVDGAATREKAPTTWSQQSMARFSATRLAAAQPGGHSLPARPPQQEHSSASLHDRQESGQQQRPSTNDSQRPSLQQQQRRPLADTNPSWRQQEQRRPSPAPVDTVAAWLQHQQQASPYQQEASPAANRPPLEDARRRTASRLSFGSRSNAPLQRQAPPASAAEDAVGNGSLPLQRQQQRQSALVAGRSSANGSSRRLSDQSQQGHRAAAAADPAGGRLVSPEGMLSLQEAISIGESRHAVAKFLVVSILTISRDCRPHCCCTVKIRFDERKSCDIISACACGTRC